MASPKATEAAASRDTTAEALAAAVEHVRTGGLLAFPTETVWGLGADARSHAALARLRHWKGRGTRQPISVLIPDADASVLLGVPLGGAARRLAEAFWPGPLTLVVPAPPGIFAPGIARADGAVGLRCSPHPVAAALVAALARAGVGPLTATSLNRHGEAPARTHAEAAALCRGAEAPRCLAVPTAGLNDAPSGVANDAPVGLPNDVPSDAPVGVPTDAPVGVPAGAGMSPHAGLPSTVLDCTGAQPVVLRIGAIAPSELERILDERIHVLDQEIATP